MKWARKMWSWNGDTPAPRLPLPQAMQPHGNPSQELLAAAPADLQTAACSKGMTQLLRRGKPCQMQGSRQPSCFDFSPQAACCFCMKGSGQRILVSSFPTGRSPARLGTGYVLLSYITPALPRFRATSDLLPLLT